MAKEFLFRAKRKNTEEWAYGWVFKHKGKYHLCNKTAGMSVTVNPGTVKWLIHVEDIEIEEETIGRCTGILDRNDKDIYEGDIVKWYFKTFSQLPIREYVGKIVWAEDSAAFAFEFLDNKCQWGLNSNYQNYYEVIGNIYDNPELLRDDAQIVRG